MEPSYKFSYEIHKNFSYEFHMNNEKAPYEFDMKFMTCVCWVLGNKFENSLTFT